MFRCSRSRTTSDLIFSKPTSPTRRPAGRTFRYLTILTLVRPATTARPLFLAISITHWRGKCSPQPRRTEIAVALCGHGKAHARGLCQPCYYKGWRAANAEKVKTQQAQYREANREFVNASSNAARAKKPEHYAALSRRWYEANSQKVKDQSAAWHRNNPERSKAARAAWQVANAEEQAEHKAAYFQANKAHRVAAMRVWRLANPEKVAVSKNRRRALRLAPGADLTNGQWNEVLVEFDGHCAYCQTTSVLILEHMTPLSRGGRHTQANVVPACAPCNNRKGARTAFEFAGLTGYAVA